MLIIDALQGHVDELLELKVQFEELSRSRPAPEVPGSLAPLPPLPPRAPEGEATPRERLDDDDARSQAVSHASPMLSHRGSKPKKPQARPREEHDGDVRVTQGAKKEDIVKDWGFTDDRVAEAMLKKRDLYLKMQQKKAKKDAMRESPLPFPPFSKWLNMKCLNICTPPRAK